MTTELTKAAQQALEQLEFLNACYPHKTATDAADALRRALTQRPAAQTEREAFENAALAKWGPLDFERSPHVPEMYYNQRLDDAWIGFGFAVAWLRASLPAPQQATPEPDDDKWRDVALRFDKHRMQALWHLQAMLQDPVKHADIVRQFLKDPTHPAVTPEPVGWTDAGADAARLAMELECLLLDTKDTAAVSRWWKSANEALDLHRARLAAAQAKGDAHD